MNVSRATNFFLKLSLIIQNNNIRLRALFILLVLTFSSHCAFSASGYPTYPTPTFHNVERICSDLVSDLTTIQFNNDFYHEWVENSDYLFRQFLQLNNAMALLLNNTEEARSYLLEDIWYLKELIESLNLSFKKIYCSTTKSLAPIETILADCKQTVIELFKSNREIMLYTENS